VTTEAARGAWAREVLDALDSLNADQRSFIRLNYFHGVTQAGIAQQCHVPAALVASTIARGMQALARALQRPTQPVELGPAA
jgi:DNA-directed RNA polymerase specialized sigma24 family protein